MSTTLRQPFCRRIDALTDLTWEDEWPECEEWDCDHEAMFVVGYSRRLGQFVCFGCGEKFCKQARIRLPEDVG